MRWSRPATVAVIGLLLAAIPVPVLATTIRPRVVNGHDVTTGAFASRWSAIAAVTSSTSWGSTLCGGVLIDERTVLTAAHCTFNPNGAPISAASMHVYVGRRIASSSDGDRIDVALITRNPSFSRLTMRNDVAVLRLTRSPLVPVGALQPTSAADESWWGAGRGKAVDGDLVGPFIAGWGATDADASRFPDTLQEAALPIAADTACAASAPPGQGSTFDPSTMVCAGAPSATRGNGIDACQGDSGGPLIVGDGAGNWRLVGLTSWGRDCGGTYYGVYTRIGRFVTWIDPLRYVEPNTSLQNTSPPDLTPEPPSPPAPPAPAPAPGPVPTAPSPVTVAGEAPFPASSAIGPLVLAHNTRPTRPTNLRLRYVGIRRVPLLRWHAAHDPGGRVVRYLLRELRRGTWHTLAAPSRTAIALRGLAAGPHHVRIWAADDVGLRSRPSRIIRIIVASSPKYRYISP